MADQRSLFADRRDAETLQWRSGADAVPCYARHLCGWPCGCEYELATQYAIMIRHPDDPDRNLKKAKQNGTDWRNQAPKWTEYQWCYGILGTMFGTRPYDYYPQTDRGHTNEKKRSPGRPKTFNAIVLELANITADMAHTTQAEQGLWNCVRQGRVEMTTEAPFLFRQVDPQTWVTGDPLMGEAHGSTQPDGTIVCDYRDCDMVLPWNIYTREDDYCPRCVPEEYPSINERNGCEDRADSHPADCHCIDCRPNAIASRGSERPLPAMPDTRLLNTTQAERAADYRQAQIDAHPDECKVCVSCGRTVEIYDQCCTTDEADLELAAPAVEVNPAPLSSPLDHVETIQLTGRQLPLFT